MLKYNQYTFALFCVVHQTYGLSILAANLVGFNGWLNHRIRIIMNFLMISVLIRRLCKGIDQENSMNHSCFRWTGNHLMNV